MFFDSPEAFREWLDAHAATSDELIVGFHKVATGKPSMSWSQSVDEALCVGWIDGVRKRIDEHSYQIRFTPRRKGSIWSAVNIAKVAQLIEQGRMRPAGLAAFAERREEKSSIYAYEQPDCSALTPEELTRFKDCEAAWAYFGICPQGYRKTLLHWITSARQPATRARRLEQLISACAEGKRLR
jgi:uncharacterized protein YdeI (YjbR/CyaY-like superfamily)